MGIPAALDRGARLLRRPHWVNSSMSAPAMKPAALPERKIRHGRLPHLVEDAFQFEQYLRARVLAEAPTLVEDGTTIPSASRCSFPVLFRFR